MPTALPWSTSWDLHVENYLATANSAESQAYWDAAPRLAPGPHWGIIEGFESSGSSTYDSVARTDELMDIAAASGASVARVQVDWSDLETAPGVYDQQALDDLLAELLQRGQAGFVTLSTLDSEGFTLPDYLSSDLKAMQPGVSFGSTQVQDAFAGLLDWLVPQLTEAGVWGLTIGNEVEIPVEDGLVTEAEAISFFEAGISRAQALDPDLAVGVTLTSSANLLAPNLAQSIAAASDIFVVNYYASQGDAQNTSSWETGLANIEGMAGGKPIFFQELGMPVGYEAAGMSGESRIAGSLEAQADFFTFMGRVIALNDQYMGATAFQLFDWSPELVDSYFNNVLDGEEAAQFSQYSEALATLGMASWSDGSTRPAWDSWLAALGEAEEIRTILSQPIEPGTETPPAEDPGTEDPGTEDPGTEDPGTEDPVVEDPVNTIYGLDSDDTIVAATANNALYLRTGNDFAMMGDGNDTIFGEAGLDEIMAGGGNDMVDGGAGADQLSGDAGDDTLIGGEGDDVLRGGDDDDLLQGGDGIDALLGGLGQDTLSGGAGVDELIGDEGNDDLSGGGDNDHLSGGLGNDTLEGDEGDDLLLGDDGADVMFGGLGLDELFGGDGDDDLQGGDGSDALLGEAGADQLTGGTGDDELFGGTGADTLTGGSGDDILIGGDGADVFVFNEGDGHDFILGFETGLDKLDLDATLIPAGASLSDSLAPIAFFHDDAVTLDFGGGDAMTVMGLSTMADLIGALDLG